MQHYGGGVLIKSLNTSPRNKGDVRFVVETLDGLSGENVGGWG